MTLSASSRSYLGKVYAWFTAGIVLTSVTAWAVVTQGATETIPVKLSKSAEPILAQVSPAVVAAVEHPWLLCGGFLLLGLFAMIVRGIKLLGPISYLLFTVLSGVLLGPSIVFATLKAQAGLTWSGNPVRDAAVITVGAFCGLTAYALASGRDFSAWGGFLTTGLFAVILAGIACIVFGTSLGFAAVSVVSAVLFCGFILYDTSNALHADVDDALGHATALYLDALNLFLDLLRIAATSASDD